MQALKGEEITVYGDGSQSRSFCYVDDLIAGVVKLMNSQDNFTGPVNLGSPIEFTILELAQKVIELTDSKSRVSFKALPADDPKQRRPDITLAEDKLSWQPQIPLEQGLTRTIKYFKGILK